MVVEEIARRAGESLTQKKFKGRFTTALVANTPTVLLLPETFMNLSGRSVLGAAGFFGADAGDIVVVHDELDLPFGRVKVKIGGGHGGHNGLRSIFQDAGIREFLRVRVGIGRPVRGDAADYVLSPFRKDERAELPSLIDRAADAAEALLRDGFTTAANEINGPSTETA
jgi:PTH1 family peptidyl-tRNA hydrolase